MSIEFYKEQFEKLGKSNIFELNKPFIEEICEIKKRIVKLRELVGNQFIIVHPTNNLRTRVPESEVWLLKLEEQYKHMIIALNKIVGAIVSDEKDPLEEWLNARRSED